MTIRLFAQVPEDGAEEEGRNNSEGQANTIVVRTAPVCPPLLPETC